MLCPRLLFVMPVSGGGGGANSVVQEAVGLRRIGVPVSIAVKEENRARLAIAYPELHAMQVPLLTYADGETLAALVAETDIVCATTNGSVSHVANALNAIKGGKKPRAAYYVQDYEPLFYPPRSPEWEEAWRSFTLIPDCVLFAKTKWLCDIVYENHGIRMAKVEPSIDHDIHYPDLARPVPRLTIVAMLRPQTPRRAPLRTVRIMEQLAATYGDRIDLHVFGTSETALQQHGIRLSPAIGNYGSLRRTEVPEVIRNTDLFLDLSDYQAFGRTSLESMACACIPVVPSLGGGAEFAEDRANCYVVDTRSDREILDAVGHFVALPPGQREQMRLAALRTAARYTVTRAALSELELFDSITR